MSRVMQQSDYSPFMYILRPLALALKHCEPKIPLSADRCSLCLTKVKNRLQKVKVSALGQQAPCTLDRSAKVHTWKICASYLLQTLLVVNELTKVFLSIASATEQFFNYTWSWIYFSGIARLTFVSLFHLVSNQEDLKQLKCYTMIALK